MKILLAAVNAKYIHTALGVRALCSYVHDPDVRFAEFTINENPQDVLRSIYGSKADTVMFSCYIWNIEFIVKVASALKKISPETVIVFGGPEVSFDSVYYMERYPFLDAVIRGEGEETLKAIVESGLDTDGVTYRDSDGNVVVNKDRTPVCDLNMLPFPYTERDIEENKNKLIYYESSRGCPFNCSYCLSSTVHSVRFRDIETVKAELSLFAKHGVRVVKLTDRTFNADRKRAAELMEFIASLDCRTQFHFEIAADLINDETVDIFRNAPRDRFLLEIGVQSTNAKTIEAIDRKTDLNKISEAVRALRGYAHMHLDLIAGLPYEDHKSFVRSFNDVMEMRPDVLQLGFLKLLRGTKLRREVETHGYIFTDDPPYEVLGNKYISYEELLELKRIEQVLDKYYNSGAFKNIMDHLLNRASSPDTLFEKIAEHFEENGYFGIGLSRDRLYDILASIVGKGLPNDILKFDFFANSNNPSTPKWANEPYDRSLLKRRFDLIGKALDEGKLKEYEGIPVKEIIKHVIAERFSYDVLGNGEKIDNIILFDKRYGKTICFYE